MIRILQRPHAPIQLARGRVSGVSASFRGVSGVSGEFPSFRDSHQEFPAEFPGRRSFRAEFPGVSGTVTTMHYFGLPLRQLPDFLNKYRRRLISKSTWLFAGEFPEFPGVSGVSGTVTTGVSGVSGTVTTMHYFGLPLRRLPDFLNKYQQRLISKSTWLFGLFRTAPFEKSGEESILQLGHTNALRVLFQVWTPCGYLVRPVTAFEPPRVTRHKYVATIFG